MGNREDLLAGARRVIVEQGMAKATARDIAAASGVSLAAIGYHFGSKEQLLTEALNDALGSAIGDGMGALIRQGGGHAPLDAFARMWDAVPQIFEANRDALMASVENIVRVVRDASAQQQMGVAIEQAHQDFATDFETAHPELEPEQARALAELTFALVQGYAILWLMNPSALVGGDRLAAAIDALAVNSQDG